MASETLKRFGARGWDEYLLQVEEVASSRVEGEKRYIEYSAPRHRGPIARMVQLDLPPATIAAVMGVTVERLERWIADDPLLRGKLVMVTRVAQMAKVYDRMYREAVRGNTTLLLWFAKNMKLDQIGVEASESDEALDKMRMSDPEVRRLLERMKRRLDDLEEVQVEPGKPKVVGGTAS